MVSRAERRTRNAEHRDATHAPEDTELSFRARGTGGCEARNLGGGRNRVQRSTFSVLRSAFVLLLLAATACKPSPLTAQKAEEILKGQLFNREPVYAEVPQRVWWSTASPKDDYDELALRTLRNLQRAGLVTVTESLTSDGASYQAKVTQKGFNILGTMPSMRGPVYRTRIAEKKYDGIRNFVRHPNDPTVGTAELVWHYENPTPYYPLFETKINKPLNTPFISLVSFHWEKQQWRVNVVVPKEQAGQR